MKRPVRHVEPSNVVEAFVMLASGDLPHNRPKGGFMGLKAPLGFGFLLGLVTLLGFIGYACVLNAMLYYGNN